MIMGVWMSDLMILT